MKFYLKKSTGKEWLIMMLAYDARFKDRTFKYSTHERISPKAWDHKKNMPKPGNDSLTERLLEIQKDAMSYMRLNRRGLTREGLRDHLNGSLLQEEIRPSLSMVAEWEAYLKALKGSIDESTLRSYTDSFNSFDEFMKDKSVIPPREFDFRIYQKYAVVLKEKYAPNTVAKKLKHFKRFVTYLEKMGVRIGFDKDEIEYSETPGIQIALTQEEYDKLCGHAFDGKMNDMRWLFILQCSTGLRISDLLRLEKNIRGNYIIIETKKVKGNVITIPITPIVRQVLEKYHYQLPKISEQEYREAIKEMYKAINPDASIQVRTKEGFSDKPVWQEISSHDAVRTFITLSDQRGITHSSIAKMTGKSIKTIHRHYLVESQARAEKEMMEHW